MWPFHGERLSCRISCVDADLLDGHVGWICGWALRPSNLKPDYAPVSLLLPAHSTLFLFSSTLHSFTQVAEEDINFDGVPDALSFVATMQVRGGGSHMQGGTMTCRWGEVALRCGEVGELIPYAGGF